MSGNKRIFDQIYGSNDDVEHEVRALDADADSVCGQNMTTDPTATHPATSGNQNAKNQAGVDPGNADVPMDRDGSTNTGTGEPATDSSKKKKKTVRETEKPRKRRKKGDPKPDYTAAVIEKSKKLKRVAQACDHCHIEKLRCDNGVQGCYNCLHYGHACIMTNRVTKISYLRGGGDGVVVNFEDIQDENTDLKAKNEELNRENEQLRAENSDLRVQMQYFQSLTSSIGATSGPNHTQVSHSNGNTPNPHVIQQSYPKPYNTQPIASNYDLNSNAFSGNMEIGHFSNISNMLPGNTVPNTVPFPQWAQPNIAAHEMPATSHNIMMTYPSNFSQAPVQNASFQPAPVQNANNQCMRYPARPWQKFQGPCVQVPGAQQRLPQPQTTGNKQPNVQHRNPPTQSLQHPPMPLPYQTYQYPNTNGQNQNNRVVQGPSSTAVPVQQQRDQLQLDYTVQNPGRQLPSNQNPQHQNVSMATQYRGNHQASNMNAQNQGMQNSRLPNHGLQDPNARVRNTGTQNQDLQPQNANTQNRNLSTATQQHQTRAKLSNNVQNPSTANQNLQSLSRPQSQSQSQPQVQQSQHQNTGPQNPEPKNVSSNTQDFTLPDTGPTQLPDTLFEKGNNTWNGDGSDNDGIQKILDGFRWTPQLPAGEQYLFDDIMANTTGTTGTTGTTAATQGQQVVENIGGNNTLPDMAVDAQPQRSRMNSIDALFPDIDDMGTDDWQGTLADTVDEPDTNFNCNPNPNCNGPGTKSYQPRPSSGSSPPSPSGDDGTSGLF